MATVHSTQPKNIMTPVAQKTVAQMVFMSIGIVFMVLTIIGLAVSYPPGIHFSAAHNIVHFIAGAVTLYFGFQRDSKKTYMFGYLAGSFFLLLGILGFVIGSPAYLTTMPTMPADQSLWIIAPNVFELGTLDHYVHLILGAALIMGGVNAKRSLNRIRIAVNK